MLQLIGNQSWRRVDEVPNFLEQEGAGFGLWKGRVKLEALGLEGLSLPCFPNRPETAKTKHKPNTQTEFPRIYVLLLDQLTYTFNTVG